MQYGIASILSDRSTQLAAMVVICAAGGVQAALQQSYEKMVVFGASYVDDAHVLPKAMDSRFAPQPYDDGRFSNGPVSSEYLANLTGVDSQSSSFMNNAYAGAVVSNDLTPGVTSVYDIGDQISNFISSLKSSSDSSKRGVTVVENPASSTTFTAEELAALAHRRGPSMKLSDVRLIHRRRRSRVEEDLTKRCDNHTTSPVGAGSSGGNSTAGGNALVVIEVGLNSAKYLLDNSKATSDNINANVQKLGEAVSMVVNSPKAHSVSSNGKLDILVLPMFPLQVIPNWSQNNVDLNTVSTAVTSWNTALKSTLATIAGKSNGDRILSWDPSSFWTQAQTASSKAGLFGISLENTKSACYNEGSGSTCGDPASYLFWDSIHLTTVGHQAMAKSLFTNAYQVGA